MITLNDLDTIVFGQIGSKSATATAYNFISLTSPLSLVVIGDNSYEEYQINSIDVEIIPEPATVTLLAVGGLVLLRKKGESTCS